MGAQPVEPILVILISGLHVPGCDDLKLILELGWQLQLQPFSDNSEVVRAGWKHTGIFFDPVRLEQFLDSQVGKEKGMHITPRAKKILCRFPVSKSGTMPVGNLLIRIHSYRTTTAVPSSTSRCPATIRRSPGRRPLVIWIRSRSTTPTSTWRALATPSSST